MNYIIIRIQNVILLQLKKKKKRKVPRTIYCHSDVPILFHLNKV